MNRGILGGGPAGLTISRFLGGNSEVLEKNLSPGGAAGSFFESGFTFDYGPHIMFSKNKQVLEFMIRELDGNVHQCKRNNKIIYKNKILKYPFENDLYSLDRKDNYECISGFLFNENKIRFPNPKNLNEWLLHNFGNGISEKYLIPYNKKVWNIPVEDLSMIWADRIPLPSPEDVLKSSIGIETEGYLHQLYYHYPLNGGYQALSEVFAKKVNVHYNYDIKKISLINNRFHITNGISEKIFDQIISTLPIQELIKILDIEIPEKIRKAIDQLIVNPMFIVSLGIKGEDMNKYTALYFPEEEFLVNRVSFPTTFSPFNSPEGCYSVQAEITCLSGSQLWNKADDEILQHVIDGLESRSIIKRSDIIYKNVSRRQYAYVVYDVNYLRNVELIRSWFQDKNIWLAGRFSYFEYLNVDGIIERNIDIVKKINGKIIDVNSF